MPKHDIDLRLPAGLAEHLGYYVYIYVDPRNDEVFYVGKGKGNRLLAHLADATESDKVQRIRELHDLGLKPRIEVLAHALPDEPTAFRVEAAAIDLLGVEELTNQVRGWHSVQNGRMSLEELTAYYCAKPVKITHPALLVRVNRLYRHGMADLDLYEATRGIWRIGPRRAKADYAMAVFEGIVREVYEIAEWFPALTTQYFTRPELADADREGRWEFVGRQAPAEVRNRYRLRSVREYLSAGSQNPIAYVNVE